MDVPVQQKTLPRKRGQGFQFKGPGKEEYPKLLFDHFHKRFNKPVGLCF